MNKLLCCALLVSSRPGTPTAALWTPAEAVRLLVSRPARGLFLDISIKWTTQETFPPKYLHYDPESSRQLMCDKCPPGTFLKQPCTGRRKTVCAPCPDHYYTDTWHTSDECLYCSPVCKELQYVKQECNRTHNRVCECEEGRYLELEFCLKHRSCPPGFGVLHPGTPERNTVCKRCPDGFFSNETSSKAPCRKHTNCSAFGLLLTQKGNATHDNICSGSSESLTHKCGIDNLPGTKVNAESVERIKRRHNSREQTFQLLKLWKHQNKDQDMVKKIIQDINLCENTVRRHIGHMNLTFEQLLKLMESLPGKKVTTEDIEKTVKTCKSSEQLLKLLSLWRIKNGDQDTRKGLLHALKHLKTYHFPKTVTQSLKKTIRFLHSFTMYRLYRKLFLGMIGNQVHSLKISCL
ncbi:TNFRSF11B [Cervus elaphus hippelaphus]|uniref:Tumor necrosis factor receptor superfamily member 11B n=1 Tax=Cervus elaphus hippelaphus TaxID=46360 RepID=A0A212CE42_CEREH|nr:TNFRSF11B [Cervus elaphus hippelaphus]